MNKDQVFVDTSFFKALMDPQDEFYIQALKILEKLKEEEVFLITSNYILDESFTLLRVRRNLALASQLKEYIIKSTSAIKIARVTVTDEANAWKWFVRDWSDLSFTDCVSFALMKRLELTRVATFDQDFTRAGFEIEKA